MVYRWHGEWISLLIGDMANGWHGGRMTWWIDDMVTGSHDEWVDGWLMPWWLDDMVNGRVAEWMTWCSQTVYLVLQSKLTTQKSGCCSKPSSLQYLLNLKLMFCWHQPWCHSMNVKISLEGHLWVGTCRECLEVFRHKLYLWLGVASGRRFFCAPLWALQYPSLR